MNKDSSNINHSQKCSFTKIQFCYWDKSKELKFREKNIYSQILSLDTLPQNFPSAEMAPVRFRLVVSGRSLAGTWLQRDTGHALEVRGFAFYWRRPPNAARAGKEASGQPGCRLWKKLEEEMGRWQKQSRVSSHFWLGQGVLLTIVNPKWSYQQFYDSYYSNLV